MISINRTVLTLVFALQAAAAIDFDHSSSSELIKLPKAIFEKIPPSNLKKQKTHAEIPSEEFSSNEANEDASSSTSNSPSPPLPKEPTKEELYEKAIKGLAPFDGYMSGYIRKNRELLLVIPKSRLNKLWHILFTIHSGASISPADNAPYLQSGDHGFSTYHEVFWWVKNGDQMWLVKPNQNYRWSPDNPLKEANRLNFPQPILAGLKIEQEHPTEGLYLVNATPLFTGELFLLQDLVNLQFGFGFNFDREKFFVRSVKSLKENCIVQTFAHYTNYQIPSPLEPLSESFNLRLQLEDFRSLPLTLTFSLAPYNKSKTYMPRIANQKVGYFTVDYRNIDNFQKEDNEQHFIWRWDLQKKFPKEKLSEPVKPIVFTLSPSVPEKYYKAIQQGIKMWDKAFKAVGFKDAIRLQQAYVDNHWDHADGRYNVIEWVISPETAIAKGYCRPDPITGEILNANILIDENWTRVLDLQYAFLIEPSATTVQAAEKMLTQPGETKKWMEKYGLYPPNFSRPFKQEAIPLTPSPYQCFYGKTLSNQSSLAWDTAMMASKIHGKPQISKEEFITQFLATVVAHEFGHILGLRHNYVGSRWLNTDHLGDDRVIEKFGASVSSVMDYVPINIQAALNGGKHFSSPGIGPYDRWAIKYGYEPIIAKRPEDELFQLKQIASYAGKSSLAYQTDDDLFSPNPYAVLFDHASDPINYARKMLGAAEAVRKYAVNHWPGFGEDYSFRTRRILGSIETTIKQGQMVVQFIGGIDTNRNFRGDIDEKPTMQLIDPEQQRQALLLITKECLSPGKFELPEPVLNSLSMKPSWKYEPNTWNAPLRQIISQNQILLLYTLLSYDILSRVIENQYKRERLGNYYTLDEHYYRIFESVFKEIVNNSKVSSTRRDLQKAALYALILQASMGMGLNEDVRVVASKSIGRLEKMLECQLKNPSAIDSLTRDHYKDLYGKTLRYRNRQTIVTPTS